MSNKTYLLRASAVALLLWGSVALVLFIAKRPSPNGAVSNSDGVVAASK